MQQTNWRSELRGTRISPAELLEQTGLTAIDLPLAGPALAAFPLRITDILRDLIQPEDPHDPILRQFYPHADEDLISPGYTHDPLVEQDVQPVPGLLHKYHGRALLVVTGACAVHCRYCFRRHFPYADSNPSPQHWQQALDYIRADETLSEIILSGGDPLTLDDEKLGELAQTLATVPHLQRLRIHTRMPVVLPERITDALLTGLTKTRLQAVMVIHANHARELGDKAQLAIARLLAAGMPVLNQSVLLRGVNDSVETLITLSERLFACGVIPYYLHMLDPVAGAAHFHVDNSMARQIISEMKTRLPGYLVPRLVREVPGAAGKTSVESYTDQN